MGRKWSVLKDTWTAIKDAQCFSKILSNAFRMSRAVSVAPVRKTIFDLPTEIMLEVKQYLPPSSLVSFDMYMLESEKSPSMKGLCEAQSSFCGPTIPLMMLDDICREQGTLSFRPTSTSRTPLHLSERSELLCMLERDGNIPSSKAVCSGCGDIHGASLFSTSSLAQPGRKRRCLRTAGSLWICPHWIVDHGQAQDPREAKCSRCCESNGVFVLSEGTTLWYIMEADQDKPPSNDQVKEALRPLTAHVCPHLRLNDPYVSDLYAQDCRKLRWDRNESFSASSLPDCQCVECSLQLPWQKITDRECASCGTTFGFYFRPEDGPYQPKESLVFYVMRNIGNVWVWRDRAWIAQLTDPADFEEYERAWQTTKAECERRME